MLSSGVLDLMMRSHLVALDSGGHSTTIGAHRKRGLTYGIRLGILTHGGDRAEGIEYSSTDEMGEEDRGSVLRCLPVGCRSYGKLTVCRKMSQ